MINRIDKEILKKVSLAETAKRILEAYPGLEEGEEVSCISALEACYKNDRDTSSCEDLMRVMGTIDYVRMIYADGEEKNQAVIFPGRVELRGMANPEVIVCGDLYVYGSMENDYDMQVSGAIKVARYMKTDVGIWAEEIEVGGNINGEVIRTEGGIKCAGYITTKELESGADIKASGINSCKTQQSEKKQCK